MTMFRVFHGIEAAPRSDGWCVVQCHDPVRHAEDLHVMRLRKTQEGHEEYRTGRRVTYPIVSPLFRYRLQARRVKVDMVDAKGLRRGPYAAGMEAESEAM